MLSTKTKLKVNKIALVIVFFSTEVGVNINNKRDLVTAVGEIKDTKDNEY